MSGPRWLLTLPPDCPAPQESGFSNDVSVHFSAVLEPFLLECTPKLAREYSGGAGSRVTNTARRAVADAADVVDTGAAAADVVEPAKGRRMQDDRPCQPVSLGATPQEGDADHSGGWGPKRTATLRPRAEASQGQTGRRPHRTEAEICSTATGDEMMKHQLMGSSH